MKRRLDPFGVRLVVVMLLLGLIVSACGPAAGQAPRDQGGTPAAPGAGAPPAATTAAGASGGQNQQAAGGRILFHSSQFSPVAEAEKMRNIILKDFSGQVEFAPQDTGPFADIPLAQAKAGRMDISVIGGLHGDFPPFIAAGTLDNVSDVYQKLADRKFPENYVELSKMGTTDTQYYVPWMQATYILVANKKALEYLPEGANQDALTYEQLGQWGANIEQATGNRAIGFPAGPKGLIHRFWQGYLYPSYTGTAVTGFKSPEAVKMWEDFREIWKHVNPASVNYEFMQEPLRSEEVWIAWDHVARLNVVLNERPDDFVTMPSPAGPAGRGFMPVLAGLAIPKNAPNREGAAQLIDYMTQPETQIKVMRELAFFPITDVELPSDLPAGIRLEAEAVAKQTNASDAIPSLLPIGLGTAGGEWNKVYNDAFTRIIIRNEDISTVLQQQGQTMQDILTKTGAACWPPDELSQGPCQVR